jgi:DDE superfamily endonuclease/Homeodomain-like domain-containing protein
VVSGGRASELAVDGIFWPNEVVRTQSVKEMPSVVRIAPSGETRKGLSARLQQAYASHATRPVRKVHALLWLAEGKSVGEIARTLDLGEQTVRDWLHAFVLEGLASLRAPFQGWLLTKGTAEKLNSESYQVFLKEVLDLIEGFVLLIQDNAPCHTSGPTQDFLEAHADRLAVYQLPTYSPELSPIERVGKKAKKEGLTCATSPLL